MAQYLGVDVGTQGVKALVFDAGSRSVVARAGAPLELLPIDARKHPGAAEQHPADWIAALEKALDAVLVEAGVARDAIRGIGVSGQQHGFVPLDEHDAVIRPAKLWCDTETAPEAAELSAAWGRPLPAGYTASKILWLKRHEPGHFARLRRVLLPHDYVNWWLSGVAVMEAGDASGTGLLDPRTRTWRESDLQAIDPALGERLPRLADPDRPIGTLRPELAERFGLPAEVLVAPGSGDNMMSALGAGAVREGVLVMSLGTSGTLFGRSVRPVVDQEGLVAPFCDATGAWLPLLCTMNCTTVTEEVRAATGLDHAALSEAARAEDPGCGGLTFLPYLAGERAPDWPQASGVLFGLRAGSLARPGLLYRAAIEGATFALREGYEAMRAQGVEAEEIRLVGGGSRNALWAQVVADVFGARVRFPAEPESAALGGALQAWAIGEGRPVAAFLAEQAVPMREDALEPAPDADYSEARDRYRAIARRLFAAD